MEAAAQVKEDYGKTATEYTSLSDLPQGVLEAQLIEQAIGDATGLLVLDIGGGSAVHARQAIDAGAKRVDIVDISPEMMKVGQEIESSLGRQDRIRFYEADVSKPLDQVPLEQQYDIVMANWVFDHAGTVETLEGMWQNIGTYLKPGGKFLGIRVADLRSPVFAEGGPAPEYGTLFKDLEPISGGLKYTVVVYTNPRFDFEATSMEVSYSGSLDMHHKYGIVDVETLALENTKIVKENPEFWRPFLENPFFVVVKGQKKQA
ncbi:Malonyl-[acyl-carrier protein] O-methyltransferase [Paramyrothecium foliicola]|nr:Malonyl-[acyl-carrier protein] O-methyltransferase [Paramyrothecium foliicola]